MAKATDEKPPAVPLSQYKPLASKAKRISSLIEERTRLKEEIKERDTRIDAIDEDLVPILFQAGVTEGTSIEVLDRPITVVQQDQKTFRKDWFIEKAAVRFKIPVPRITRLMEECVETKPKKPYLSVGKEHS
jgi:hypothetical protein